MFDFTGLLGRDIVSKWKTKEFQSTCTKECLYVASDHMGTKSCGGKRSLPVIVYSVYIHQIILSTLPEISADGARFAKRPQFEFEFEFATKVVVVFLQTRTLAY